MINDILIFLILFVCDLIIFACIGNLLFVSVVEYATLENAMVTLFTSALGGFDFSLLENTNKGHIVGEIYLLIFILMNTILILNLLIAILADTYSLYKSQELVLYINEILMLRPSMEYNSNCSALVSTFAPLNLIPFVFSPLFFIKKKTKTLNNVVLCLEFIPVMIIISVFYLAISLVLLPFTYIKAIFVKFQIML